MGVVPGVAMICTRCDNTATDGFRTCAVCRRRNNERHKSYYAAHAEKMRERSRKYESRRTALGQRKAAWRANPAKWLSYRAKQRALAAGLEFSINWRDVTVPDICPILGITLKCGDGRTHAGSPSIDRLDPSKGYVPDNVWIISHRANQIKSDGTAEEHERVAFAMRQRTFWRRSRSWFQK